MSYSPSSISMRSSYAMLSVMRVIAPYPGIRSTRIELKRLSSSFSPSCDEFESRNSENPSICERTGQSPSNCGEIERGLFSTTSVFFVSSNSSFFSWYFFWNRADNAFDLRIVFSIVSCTVASRFMITYTGCLFGRNTFTRTVTLLGT